MSNETQRNLNINFRKIAILLPSIGLLALLVYWFIGLLRAYA